MREIKFRAWDKERKTMVEVLEITFMFEGKDGIWISGYDNDSIDHEIFPENLELMQFTGLLDKNGKEIYEGDILRQHKNKGTIFTVIWDKDGIWRVKELILIGPNEIDDLSQDFLWRWAKVTEVIGNIWENPELLEGK